MSMAPSLGGASSQMLAKSSSNLYGFADAMSGRSYKDYELRRKDHVYYFPDKDTLHERDRIPATNTQRIAYVTSYISTPNKLRYLCTKFEAVGEYAAFQAIDIFAKIMPLTVLYVFLGIYVPDQHMFLSKMAPITRGWEFMQSFVGVLECMSAANYCVLLLDFVVKAAIFQNSFYRCDDRTYVTRLNQTVHCYTPEEFQRKHLNESLEFFQLDDIYYATESKVYFKSSMTMDWRFPTTQRTIYKVYFITIWFLIVIAHRNLFSAVFWKIFNITNHIFNGTLLVCLIDLLIITHDKSQEDLHLRMPNMKQSMAHNVSYDFLAELMAAPPILHLFTARSDDEVRLEYDSAIYILWISIYPTIRAAHQSILRWYVEMELLMKFPDYSCHRGWFMMWPVYFRQYYYGNFFVILFYVINFLNHFAVTSLTTNALVEVILCEWDVNKWIVLCALLGLGWGCVLIIPERVLMYVLFVLKAISQSIEAVTVVFLYPLQRLFDDMKFHSGKSTYFFRVWNFRTMAPYILYRTYGLISGIIITPLRNKEMILFTLYAVFGMTCFFLLIGFGRNIYSSVIKTKQGWGALFRPLNDWGPKEYLVRQLRKRYDVRQYVKSFANRDISRYLMRKTSSRVYRLDLRYGGAGRASRSSVAQSFSNDRRASSRHYF